ncbi:MAG: glycosyltransferase family 2 protein [Atopobiaceae bacterium]|jgi:glycosyltransferase involved in cell wall biosynthesis|nr:glycosyltransferase family 2 protein [Atopobiaceae bacterium]MCI2174028.1 glycosyltransferase family 2 protein [Atopobiaceae bacterium]MCI2207882.1 glycosyltransferase family 2 protein [Atopobiaceae bacterium]
MDLSIIVPCYNEADNLRLLFDAVASAFAGEDIDYEVILVDDGSSDGSAEVMDGLVSQGDVAHVTLVSFSRNFGKEAAILAGLEHARGDVTGLIDSDMQQEPTTLLEMYRLLMGHPEYDCVAAYQETRHEGASQGWLKRSFYKAFNKVSDTDLRPDASDFRVFRKNVRDAVLSMHEYYRFSKGIFAWVGFHTHYLPYVPSERAHGSSKWSMRALMSYALGGIMSFSTLPLRVATWVGALSALAAVIYAIVVIVERVVLRNSFAGYATIVCLILLIGGLILMTLGIIGEYLARTYVEGKHRPVYIARDVRTFDSAPVGPGDVEARAAEKTATPDRDLTPRG